MVAENSGCTTRLYVKLLYALQHHGLSFVYLWRNSNLFSTYETPVFISPGCSLPKCNTWGSREGNGLSQNFRVTKKALQCGLPSPSLGLYHHHQSFGHQVGPGGRRHRTVCGGGSRRVGDSKKGLRPGLFSSLVVVGHYHKAYPTRHGV